MKPTPAPRRRASPARATASSSPISRPARATCPARRMRLPTPSPPRSPSGPPKACPRTRKAGWRRRPGGSLSTPREGAASAEAASDALALIDADLKEAAEAAVSIPDRRLALMFACADPAIEELVRGAFDVADHSGPRRRGDRFGLPGFACLRWASALPAPKRKSASPACRSRIPECEELPQRLSVALEAIYAAFSHGWAVAFSDDPRGRNLAEEAIWLGRAVVSLAPD